MWDVDWLAYKRKAGSSHLIFVKGVILAFQVI